MDTDKKFVLDKEELESAEFPQDELFSLQVNHDDVKYEFLIRFSSESENLVCFGSGAYDPSKFKPPVYNRHTWYLEFAESVIYYNDPTLYNDDKLTLGWGVGKNGEWYLPVIADILKILAHKNRVENENMLFFGSSGGGFTSVVLSTLLKGSIAVVNNPQMILQNYYPSHFDRMMNACFDEPGEDTVSKYRYRFDALELFKIEKYVPNITYLVNINSQKDIKNQLIPFINSLTSFEDYDSRVEVLLYPSKQGHRGVMEKDETIKLIKDHLKGEPIYVSQKELEEKEQRIIELQTIRGYTEYKVKNIIMRLKNRAETVYRKIQKPYYELHQYLPGVDYDQLTVVVPYRRYYDPDREENLGITIQYLSSVGIHNLIISEHSDESVGEELAKKYGALFKSFQVVHTDAQGGVFNRAQARNIGVMHSTTPYIATSDMDCVTRKRNINIALGLLSRGYEVVHPFNRRVTDIVDKASFTKNFDFSTVETPEQKRSTADGGIIFWNKRSFVSIGMENEYFLGWGGEDNEIMYRANLCGLKQYRVDDTLYHLYHHRPQVRTKNNVELEEKTRQLSSKDDCLREINTWPWVKEAKKKFAH